LVATENESAARYDFAAVDIDEMLGGIERGPGLAPATREPA